MKRFFMILLLGLPFAFWLMFAFNTEVIRFRLTVEVQTPAGPKSGSSVIEVRYVDEPVPGSGMVTQAHVRGESVAVDLDGGKTIFALLTSGPRGEGVDWARYVRNYTDPPHPKPATGLAGVLASPNRPTIVFFDNIADPATAKVIFADESRESSVNALAATFGPGHALGKVTVTYVNPGLWITQIWPFSIITAPSPQWLFGTPVTRVIEAKLPFLVTHRDELWKRGITTKSGLELNTFSFVKRGI